MNEPMTDFARLAVETAKAMHQATRAGIEAGKMSGLTEITRIRNEAEQLAATLEDVLEFLDGQVDVVDGDYGIPEPNRAMIFTQEIKRVLAEYEKATRPSDIPPGPLKGNDGHF